MALLNLFQSGADGPRPAMHMRGKRGGEDSESQEDEVAWRHVHGRSPDSTNTCIQPDLDTPGVSGWKAVLLSVEVH